MEDPGHSTSAPHPRWTGWATGQEHTDEWTPPKNVNSCVALVNGIMSFLGGFSTNKISDSSQFWLVCECLIIKRHWNECQSVFENVPYHQCYWKPPPNSKCAKKGFPNISCYILNIVDVNTTTVATMIFHVSNQRQHTICSPQRQSASEWVKPC